MSRIRLVDHHDAGPLAELQALNRRFLAPWEPEREEDHFTHAGQSAVIDSLLVRHARGEAAPFVVLDDSGVVVGQVTLNGITRGCFQSCTVGYWLSEASTGRGLATQAVAAAVTYAFTNLALHRVQAEALPSNTASQRVLARNGFVAYGLAPQYLRIAGRWQDHLMFQRLAGDEVEPTSIGAPQPTVYGTPMVSWGSSVDR